MLYRSLPDQPVSDLRLLRFGLHGHRGDLLRFATASLVTAGLGLVVPLATGTVLGIFAPHGDRELIVLTCFAVVLMSLLAAASSMVRNIALLRIEGRSDAALGAAVWDRLLRVPVNFFGRFSTGELVSTALGVSHIRQSVTDIAGAAFESGLIGMVSL